jgi:hypothetical protein
MEPSIEKSLCGQFEVVFHSQLKILRSNPSTVRKVKNHVDSDVNGSVTVVLPVSEPLSKKILLDSFVWFRQLMRLNGLCGCDELLCLDYFEKSIS